MDAKKALVSRKVVEGVLAGEFTRILSELPPQVISAISVAKLTSRLLDAVMVACVPEPPVEVEAGKVTHDGFLAE